MKATATATANATAKAKAAATAKAKATATATAKATAKGKGNGKDNSSDNSSDNSNSKCRSFDFALRAPLRMTTQKKMAAVSSAALRAKMRGFLDSLRSLGMTRQESACIRNDTSKETSLEMTRQWPSEELQLGFEGFGAEFADAAFGAYD